MAQLDVEDAAMAPATESDSCRICRAEASTDAPLFYPCKCSGSIKFVHQDCLMEWLSHSQKKYCELCKTPFRFTKLYHPQMPRSLPTTVFLQRAALHVASHLMLWCRSLLVCTVWLFCLPWGMRYTWRMLFWFGDAGWARDAALESSWPSMKLNASSSSSSPSASQLLGSSSASPRSRSNYTIPAFLLVQPHTLNASLGEPLLYRLAKTLVHGMMLPFGRPELLIAMGSNSSDIDAATLEMIKQKHSSILSDLPFLNHFSDSPLLNRVVIDVLEGLIITLSVVVAFILIFLIREWVVQQQPVVDLAAAADADNALARAGGQAQQAPHDFQRHVEADTFGNHADHVHDHDDHDDHDDHVDHDEGDENDESDMDSDASSSVTSSTDWPVPLGGNLAQPEVPAAREEGPAMHVLDQGLTPSNQQAVAAVRADSAGPDSLTLIQALPSSNNHDHVGPGEPMPTWNSSIPNSDAQSSISISSTSESFGTQNSSRDGPIDSNLVMTGNLASSSSSSTRPDMPSRGKSFIASEIRRNLEERSLEPGDASRGSWQDIKNSRENMVLKSYLREISSTSLDGEDGSESKETPSSSKGKERAVEENIFITTEHHSESLSRMSVSQQSNGHLPPSVTEESLTLDAQIENLRDGIPTDSFDLAIRNLGEDDPVETAQFNNTQVETNGTLSNQADVPPDSIPDSPAEGDPPVMDQKQNVVERLYNWFWGDIAPVDAANRANDDSGNDEHVVNDLADEAPFVRFNQAQPVFQAQEAAGAAGPAEVRDPEVAAAAAQAGIDLNDPDAVDDVEDLEGILELIGMQGPLIGLFQNALFSSLLIAGTVIFSVFLPYLLGKMVLLCIGTPDLIWKIPLHLISTVADFTMDTLLFIGGSLVYLATSLLQRVVAVVAKGLDRILTTDVKVLDVAFQPARSLAERAGGRLVRYLAAAFSFSDSSALLHFSMKSHAALPWIHGIIISSTAVVSDVILSSSGSTFTENLRSLEEILLQTVPRALYKSFLNDCNTIISIFKSLMVSGTISLTFGDSSNGNSPLDPLLAYWSARDRTVAMLTGYAYIAFLGAIYLAKLAPITTSRQGRRIEQLLIEIVQQAGGVLKVIFIISIEMIAFPLFCGFLLDLALLPLFESATLRSRIAFTIASPWTSGFVHWFVGTCYMFHFALFVSMCRKIMRAGVLYFIRDPDDPTFHPVRDVLERNVAVQLRKIAFSGVVYGTLIVLCLGGVVWSLFYTCKDVLPIHWTSSESALEFPLDILFYNFLTPVVVRFAKPSDGLQSMYRWWFRRCARVLRLSQFLFDEEEADEEGRYVRRTWKAWLLAKKCDPPGKSDSSTQKEDPTPNKEPEVYFVPDGRYVRAPASDQIRIPKGGPVFVEVDKNDLRLDGGLEEGVHARGSSMITTVYIPPWFKVRIGIFVLLVWLFAAATGLSVTVLPLLFGRTLLSSLVPNVTQINDIYAFSLGIYILGAVLYIALHTGTILSFIRTKLLPSSQTGAQTLATLKHYMLRAASVTYVYSTFAIGLPILFAIILELYVLMPVHMYFGPKDTHIVHLVQDWTLGILYVRIFSRILLSNEDSRPARIVRAILQDGYLNPNARLATRAFILPALLLFCALTLTPFASATLANRTIFATYPAHQKIVVLRMVYPFALGCVGWLWCVRVIGKATARWRQRIKDEVYLIGERLHNFGEKRPGPPSSGRVEHLKLD